MMKRLLFSALFFLIIIAVQAQDDKTSLLQDLEKNRPASQDVTVTATLKSASRLFGTKDDLTSVIMVIPSGSTVNVMDTDSAYLHVVFEGNEGFIFKRHAVIDKKTVIPPQTIQQQQTDVQEQPGQKKVMSRLSYLENKYGSDLAAKLNAGKIWKGMSNEMVTDSWGIADKTNRVNSGDIAKEEWIYKNTWLYFENSTLLEWGPVKK